MDPFQIVIIDDAFSVVEAMQRVFEDIPDIEVVGTASDGVTGVELVERLSPDIVLMDLVLPGIDGAEATKRICEQNRQIKVIMLTQHLDHPRLFQAIRNGAWGYVPKGQSSFELIALVRHVGANYAVYGAEIARQIQAFFFQVQHIAPSPVPFTITNREQEVLTWVMQGKIDKEIAQLLRVSPRTVNAHMASIFKKLEVNNRTEALLRAIGYQPHLARCASCPLPLNE